MAKYNYFENLEQLSELAQNAVHIACGSYAQKTKQEFSTLRKSCDKLICELEDTLFSDFLPPLERNNIAACAHCLSRVVDKASELIGNTEFLSIDRRLNEEGKICMLLAEQLKTSISMLRHIRKPDEMPDIQGFRKLLDEGRCAHNSMLSKLHSGIIPRSYAQSIILTGRLRSELSRCFDELVEIMLNNI